MSETAKLELKFMKEKVISLSDKAVDRIKEIMSQAENTTIGVRV